MILTYQIKSLCFIFSKRNLRKLSLNSRPAFYFPIFVFKLLIYYRVIFFIIKNIIYRNTWLGNEKLLIIDFIVNIILDYLKWTVHNLFTITTNIRGGVL